MTLYLEMPSAEEWRKEAIGRIAHAITSLDLPCTKSSDEPQQQKQPIPLRRTTARIVEEAKAEQAAPTGDRRSQIVRIQPSPTYWKPNTRCPLKSFRFPGKLCRTCAALRRGFW